VRAASRLSGWTQGAAVLESHVLPPLLLLQAHATWRSLIHLLLNNLLPRLLRIHLVLQLLVLNRMRKLVRSRLLHNGIDLCRSIFVCS
jgi:hypothetical protein